MTPLYVACTLPFPHLMWAGTAMSLFSLVPSVGDIHVDLFNGDLVRTRSRILTSFLASDAEACFMLDADVSIDGPDVQRLLDCRAPIVAAPYPKKHARLLMRALRESTPDAPLYDRPWDPVLGAEADPVTKLLPCNGIAMGATVIRRSAAQAIADACEIEFLDEYTLPSGDLKRVPTKAVFMLEHAIAPSIAGWPDGQMHLYPEDYSFCRRARALGITPYIHTGTNARHAGVLGLPF